MNLGSTRKNKKILKKENFSKMHRFLRIRIWSLQRNFQKLRGENWFFLPFGHNFSQNGLIFARSPLDCHIFSTLSVNTHIGYSKSHKAIWLYSFIAIIWLYGCIKAVALWLFRYPIWVSTERALKIWQSSEDLAKIIPFCEKLWPNEKKNQFPPLNFWKFLCKLQMQIRKKRCIFEKISFSKSFLFLWV